MVAEGDPRPNVLSAEVLVIRLTGAGYRLRVRVAQAGELDLVLPVASPHASRLVIGERVILRIPPEAIHPFASPDQARQSQEAPYPTNGADLHLPTPGA
ncbi:TOBE domain protein [compost metagenome]